MARSLSHHCAASGWEIVAAFTAAATSFVRGPPNAGSRAHSNSRDGLHRNGCPTVGRHCSSMTRRLRSQRDIGRVRCAVARTTNATSKRSAFSMRTQLTHNSISSVSTTGASERMPWRGAISRLEHTLRSRACRMWYVKTVFNCGHHCPATISIAVDRERVTPLCSLRHSRFARSRRVMHRRSRIKTAQSVVYYNYSDSRRQ